MKLKNNFYHGIMFHHFHDAKKHYMGQGSIDKNKFNFIIKYLGRKNILNPDEFIYKWKQNELKNNHLCLTFDDGLKCQFDIAFPLLERFKIQAFFFPNTINLTNRKNYLELFRAFRHTSYDTIDQFYYDFFKALNIKNLDLVFKKKNQLIKHWKIKFPFYSISDIRFRILREFLINEKKYEETMFKLIKNKKFEYKKKINQIYMTHRELKTLSDANHNIGLHSHSHPTLMRKLPLNNQIKEYTKNKKILESILKKKVNSMSHPCGSYSSSTLKILKKLELDIGFRSTVIVDMNMKKINNSKFEIAREDHSNILNTIKS